MFGHFTYLLFYQHTLTILVRGKLLCLTREMKLPLLGEREPNQVTLRTGIRKKSLYFLDKNCYKGNKAARTVELIKCETIARLNDRKFYMFTAHKNSSNLTTKLTEKLEVRVDVLLK